MPAYIFIANMDTAKPLKKSSLPKPAGNWQLCFSTEKATIEPKQFTETVIHLENILPGEGLVLGNVTRRLTLLPASCFRFY